jgi:hypothetical protein
METSWYANFEDEERDENLLFYWEIWKKQSRGTETEGFAGDDVPAKGQLEIARRFNAGTKSRII